MRLIQPLFNLSPVWFAVILVFQQLFDLVSTLYLTSTPHIIEINPLLTAMWEVSGGLWWLISAKFWLCIILILGITHWHEDKNVILGAKFTFVIYLFVMLWNSALVVSTML